MKKLLLFKTLFVSTLFVFVININSAFAVARTWTGAINTDFNNVGNWTGGGALAAADNFTVSATGNLAISLSASITVNNLSFTLNTATSVNRQASLDVLGFVLTINGTGTFNAVQFWSGTRWDKVILNVNTGGNIIFNGQAYIHTNGQGDTYIFTNYNTGSIANPGTLTFNANLYVGIFGRTFGDYEPNIIFNKAGAQTAIFNCVGAGIYYFKAQDLTFGTTNTPIVTIRGPGAAFFDSYDGNMTVASNSNVIVPDTTSVGYMCILDRFNTGAGTLTMGAGSSIVTGCPNVTPMTGFATYSLNPTSTVSYNSASYQIMMPITYGHVIADGVGSPGWKYSNGAQTMVGNFTVQNSAIYGPFGAGGITVQGNTLLQSSAVFNATRDNSRPNTTHTFLGNFTNNASFSSGSPVGINTMQFTGASAQTISGTTLTTAFYNLTINNTSATGVTLAAPLQVNTALTLTDGYVYTTATNLLTLIDNATSTSGSSASFVDGPMKKIGNDIFTFPTGNQTFWARIGITAPVLTTDAFTATYHNAAYTSLTPITAPLAYVSSVEHWILDQTAGTSNVFPTLFWESGVRSGINTFTTDLRVGHYTAANVWVDEGSGTKTGSAAAGSIQTAAAVTSFSPFTFASLTSSLTTNPLPIELLNFNADLNKDKVDLKWTTATETNNDFFTIEKSHDGQNFEELLNTDGAGNSTVMIDYFEIDPDPYVGISYYRLKQIDFNGNSFYSNIVSVEYDPNGEQSISLFPNPSDAGTITYLSLNQMQGQEVLIFIKDLAGREVFSKTVISNSNSELINIYTEGILAKGCYLITASSANKFYTQKLIVK